MNPRLNKSKKNVSHRVFREHREICDCAKTMLVIIPFHLSAPTISITASIRAGRSSLMIYRTKGISRFLQIFPTPVFGDIFDKKGQKDSQEQANDTG